MVDGVKRSVAIEEQGDLVCDEGVDISHQRDGHVMRVSLDSHAVEVSPDDLGTADRHVDPLYGQVQLLPIR